MKTSALPILQNNVVESGDSWKPSLYNHFVERGDVVWGFNFISLALVRLSPGQYQIVKQILDGQHAESVLYEDLRRSLVKGKFLIPGSVDEVEFLKNKNRASRFGDHALSLIIAPTLRCNFACEYCYVDLNANKMKLEDRVKLGKFFHRKLPEGKSAHIVWTGGDPSLAMDVVEDLSLRFLESCEIKGCSYEARLITNGYLLNDSMREHLRNSKVTFLQVSVDGSREFHDSSRCLPNKKPTYDTVLGNVEDSCDEFTIYLRINVDRKNYKWLPDLFEDLEARDLTAKVFIYFAHVDNVNENSASYAESCLSPHEYAQIEASLVRLAMERGFRVGGYSVPRRPVNTFCGANMTNFYVIDSSANLLKCYHDFGAADRHGIGRIADDGSELVTNPYNLLKWLGWDPFEISECRNCKVLPLCMGGCIHKIVNSGMDIEKGCLKMRFSMDQIIEIFGESFSGGRPLSGSCGCAATASINV
jgi:uncharacterized protein